MTEVDPPLPYGYTIFCDDIRNEIAGKMIFIGVYAGEIKVLGKPPVALTKLCLAVHFFEKSGDGGEPLELMVFMPGEEAPKTTVNIPPRVHETQTEDPNVGHLASTNLILQYAPLEIKEHGNIRVRMRRGDVVHRIGALRVTELTHQEAVDMQIVPALGGHSGQTTD